jgi:putative PIN family toxin of toxin-antitoxin system
MRIVLDTNVLIAALIAHGMCSDVFEHCARQHTLIASDAILSEFRKHMLGKFKYTERQVEEAVDLLRSRMELVVPAVLEAPVCRDPDDDMILGTAMAGEAVCIVTGDKDLLDIQRFRTVDIVRPAEFAEYEAVVERGAA